MAHTMNTALLTLSLLLLISSCSAEHISEWTKPVHFIQKGGFRISPRKLLSFAVVLDYDYAGANPRHDPRRGRSGGGGRNP